MRAPDPAFNLYIDGPFRGPRSLPGKIHLSGSDRSPPIHESASLPHSLSSTKTNLQPPTTPMNALVRPFAGTRPCLTLNSHWPRTQLSLFALGKVGTFLVLQRVQCSYWSELATESGKANNDGALEEEREYEDFPRFVRYSCPEQQARYHSQICHHLSKFQPWHLSAFYCLHQHVYMVVQHLDQSHEFQTSRPESKAEARS